MALSISTKALLGLAIATPVTVGGIYFYNSKTSSNGELDIDSLVLGTTSTNDPIKWEILEQKIDNKKVVASLAGKNKKVTWTCSIEGTIGADTGNKNSGIKEQLTEKLGIDEEKREIKENKKSDFIKFLKNCIRNRDTEPKNKISHSTIDIGELDTSGDKYKFKDSEIQKLYQEIFLSSKLKEKLGISKDCVDYKTGCVLDENKLGSIRFLDKKGSNGTWNVTNANSTKIKVQEDLAIDKYEMKFIFETSHNATIKKDETKKIVLPSGSNMEFEITKEGTELFLKKLWTPEKLMQEVNLICQIQKGKTTCSLDSNNLINVYKDEGNYLELATLSGPVDLNFSEGNSGYNQGIKFTVSKDTNIVKGEITSQKGNELDSLLKNKNYEIRPKSVNNQEVFFLVEYPSP